MPKKPVPDTAATTETFEAYVLEVKRLLKEKDLKDAWIEQLVALDMPFLERSFPVGKLPVYAAFEIYVTEEESAREPDAADHRLKLDLSEKTTGFLETLVGIGLWGDSIEAVASGLIHQQLAAKFEAGLFSKK